MAASPEDLVLIERAQQSVDGLDLQEVSRAIVGTKIAHEQAQGKPTADPEGRIAFTAGILGQVAANTDQLVAFHRFIPRPGDGNDGFRYFNAIAIKPERPFVVMPDTHESPNRDEWSWSIGLRQSTMPSPHNGDWEIPASRVIAYVDGSSLEGHVDVRGGVRSVDAEPDEYYPIAHKVVHRPGSYDVAVGGAQIGALFDRVHDQVVDKQRLFGALMHISLLAHELNMELPVVSAFDAEIASGSAWLDATYAVADTAIKYLYEQSASARNMVAALKGANQDIATAMELKAEKVSIPGAWQWIVDDHGIDGLHTSSLRLSVLKDMIDECDSERVEHIKRSKQIIAFQEVIGKLATKPV